MIAVVLFGQPADYPRLRALVDRYSLKLIANSAQGFGCTLHCRHPIAWADVVTTSFCTAKPLGAYGDGGAVLTNSPELWDVMDSLRVHGKAVKAGLEGRTFDHDPKNLDVRIAINSRLDTLQAAILLVKLSVFAEEIEARQVVAERYTRDLKRVKTPQGIDGGRSV